MWGSGSREGLFAFDYVRGCGADPVVLHFQREHPKLGQNSVSAILVVLHMARDKCSRSDRYVEWTSWASAATIWPNAGDGSSTQGESSGKCPAPITMTIIQGFGEVNDDKMVRHGDICA